MDDTSSKRKPKASPTECRVCGAPALYSYFGTISCKPCKVFFKRNAEHGKEVLKCHFDGRCEINTNNRHTCASCRLDKCFRSEMKVEMIRTSINKKSKEKKKQSSPTASAISSPSEQIPLSNLLQRDNSPFTNDQWTLLTNLRNNYDETNLLSISTRIQSDIQTNQSITPINTLLIQEFLTTLYDTAGLWFRSNRDVVNLSSHDQSVLLYTATRNITLISGIFILNHSDLINNEIFMNYIGRFYAILALQSHCRLLQFTESDFTLVKLILALFAFSSTERTLHPHFSDEYTDARQILHIQNTYAEITWKYLLHQYGDSQAVRRFIHLTQFLLRVNVFTPVIQSSETHKNYIEAMIEKTELSLILDDVDNIVEMN